MYPSRGKMYRVEGIEGWQRDEYGWYAFCVRWAGGETTWESVVDADPIEGSLFETRASGEFAVQALAEYLSRPRTGGGEYTRASERVSAASVREQLERYMKGERVCSRPWTGAKNGNGWLPPGVPLRVGPCVRRWSGPRGYDLVAGRNVKAGEKVAVLRVEQGKPEQCKSWCAERVRLNGGKAKNDVEMYVCAPTKECVGVLINAAGVHETANVRFGKGTGTQMPLYARANVRKGTVLRVSCRYFKIDTRAPTHTLSRGTATRATRIRRLRQRDSGSGRFV